MTTPTHDPLTAKHEAILARAPFEMTVAEQQASPDQAAISFLLQIDRLRATQLHVSEDIGRNKYRFDRT